MTLDRQVAIVTMPQMYGCNILIGSLDLFGKTYIICDTL